jgi:hypothetical protein
MVRRFYRANGAVIRGGGGLPWNYTASAVQLPEIIPAAGQAGGPPWPADYRYIGGIGEFNMLDIFLKCVRDPEQLQPTMDYFMKRGQDSRSKK